MPTPPSFAELEAWAGPGRVMRAPASAVSAWRLPPDQRAALVDSGIPMLEGIVDVALFDPHPQNGRYHLAATAGPVETVHVADEVTGAVSELDRARGSRWFVNSSINHWLCSLHLVGTWYTTSTAIRTWDEDLETEEAALAELADLLRQIRELDPASYGDEGVHATHYWPAVLDRWLY